MQVAPVNQPGRKNKIMYVNTVGCRLWVWIEGSGLPVVLLHGFPDTHRLWSSQVTALAAAGYKAIAPDMPGFGRSEKPKDVRKYSIKHVVAALCAMLDQLGVHQAVVVGHDWGAAVAWALASQIPHKVQKLVVLSVGHPGAGAAVCPRQRAHWWYMLYFLLPGAEDSLKANNWCLFRQVMGQGCTAEQLDEYIEQLEQPGALPAALNWYRANTHAWQFGQTEPWPVAQMLPMPVLGVWSCKDTALLEPQMTASARFVAPSCWQYMRLEGAGHWIPRDAPEQLNSILLSFLSTDPAYAKHGTQQPGGMSKL